MDSGRQRHHRLGRPVRSAEEGWVQPGCVAGNPLARRRDAGRIVAAKLGRHEGRPTESWSAVMKKVQFQTISRREFVGMAAGAVALAALPYSRVLGANDRIRIGIIGPGDRGMQDLKDSLAQ